MHPLLIPQHRLEAALNVTEYTDHIDNESHTSKAKRVVSQIKELCAVLTGLVLACDYKRGQELFEERSFDENEEFFQTIFEIGRRYKIMNPEKMRSAYGKLMYMLSVCPRMWLSVPVDTNMVHLGLNDSKRTRNARV